MRLFIENKEMDNTVREIRRRIRASMNGVVADSMKEKGILYKRNFGVDLPHIKWIAGKYEPNHDLAQRLWALEIRETMIMATLLEPVHTFTESAAEKWMQSVNNIELVEQICMNLFSKLPYANLLSVRLSQSDDNWEKITGFTLAARRWKELEDVQAKELVDLAVRYSVADEFYLYRAISLSLCRLARRGKEMMDLIRSRVSGFEHAELISQRYIASEIANEISFLNF